MLKELEYQKDELADTQRQHKETVTRMERKFFEEKIRLQKEANRKISELASKAHKEAVLNLNETTKEIYKENIRMAESLRYHVQEGEELSKQNRALLQANRQLMEEKDLHNVIVKEKVLQVKQQAQEIKDLNTKIESMEHSLSHVVREFEHEREIIGKLARRELNEVRKVAARLRENLEVKSYEMKHIKRLAQHVLDQRTKLERFFMDSFDHVRCQIVKEREQAKKAAHNDYNKKIREVMSKKAQFPPVQSFRANATPLTNNQFNLSTATAVATSLMKPPLSPPTQTAIAAEDPSITSTTTQHQYQTAAPAAAVHAAGNASQVDIHDLSWADKERVLRLLFAKMNGIALGVDDDDGDEDGAGAAAEEEDPSIQDYQNDFYDDSMYHDGNGHGGGAGPVPPSEFNNVVEFSPQQQGQTQEGSSQQREPTLPRGTQPQQEPTKQNDLIITELAAGGDAQNSDIPLQDDHTQSENGDNNGGGGNRDEGEPGFLTTAYSGSRRNLLPKSDNSLPPIISAGITPRTETSRAASITSNK
ncbi:hypothetical protein BDR26DRAFT_78217 [Obelidium mucronatum]|nr:hypothetical protein BDR26DRAFT_78217 [Obelidium mucronatum]